MITSYLTIDLETTGLDPKKDKIIEIGAARVINGEIKETFQKLINPGRKLTNQIMKITGLSDIDLRKEPSISQVMEQFAEFVNKDELPILGHSVLFDYSFLKRAAINNNSKFEKNGIDTLKIARKFLPELEKRSLEYLCRYYNISHHPHRALEDAIATHFLYQKMKEQFYSEENPDSCFHPVTLLYQVKKEGPASKRQIDRIKQLLVRHKIEPGIDVNMLTRNEANRYVDQILATYGR